MVDLVKEIDIETIDPKKLTIEDIESTLEYLEDQLYEAQLDFYENRTGVNYLITADQVPSIKRLKEQIEFFTSLLVH